jgi:hydrogenase maturation protease
MVLIIGYGNPLRGDDGVGWRVVEEIERQKAEGQNGVTRSSLFNLQSIEAVACHQLMPELADTISQVERVVFVDAAVGEPAGAIGVQTVVAKPAQPGAFTHHVDPAGLLAYAEMVYGRAPSAHLVTINAERMGYEETLSPTIESALPDLMALIAKLAVTA